MQKVLRTSKRMKIISKSVNETINIGKRIAKKLKGGDIVCLFGAFGTGKTVLTKGIAQGLGMKRNQIVSPSFVLIRQLKGKMPLYHFDLYRLERPQDILGLGYEEYLYDDAVTVIEWADRLKYLLPKEYLKITLKAGAETIRQIEIIPIGKRYENIRY